MREASDYLISDQIHFDFSQNIDYIFEEFARMKDRGILNQEDLSISKQLLQLLWVTNEVVISGSEEEKRYLDDKFIRSLDNMYTSFNENTDLYSPIVVSMFSIVFSSKEYWLDQDLFDAPDIMRYASHEDFILPAILARVIIKDAIGFVTGILGAGLGKRILEGNWDYDIGKLTEKEALVSGLIGAALSSGGFLGKMAARALGNLLL